MTMLGFRLLVTVAAAVAFLAAPAAADGPPPPLPSPAVRIDLALLMAEPTANVIDPGTPGDCSSYHDVAVDAGWTEQQWPVLQKIMWRESRCRPSVVNRYGCVGLLQVCRINHARLGVTRADLQDAGTNLAIGHTLCHEWVDVGRSCWRPWWLKRWRP